METKILYEVLEFMLNYHNKLGHEKLSKRVGKGCENWDSYFVCSVGQGEAKPVTLGHRCFLSSCLDACINVYPKGTHTYKHTYIDTDKHTCLYGSWHKPTASPIFDPRPPVSPVTSPYIYSPSSRPSSLVLLTT